MFVIAQQMFNLALGIDVESDVIMLDNLDSLTQQNIRLDFLDKNINIEDNIDFKIATNFKESTLVRTEIRKILLDTKSSCVC